MTDIRRLPPLGPLPPPIHVKTEYPHQGYRHAETNYHSKERVSRKSDIAAIYIYTLYRLKNGHTYLSGPIYHYSV